MAYRTTCSELVDSLRAMTDAGTSDYTSAGTIVFWDNDQMQLVLDRHRTDVYFEQLYPIERYVSGSTIEYYEYYSEYKNFEQTNGGSAIFWIEEGDGDNVGTASWTADYLNGRITFGSNTSGTVYYLTGRSYDLNAAAADIWRQKASYYATRAVDFSTDNHRFAQSQIVKQCQERANYYANMGAPVTTTLHRSDLYVNPE